MKTQKTTVKPEPAEEVRMDEHGAILTAADTFLTGTEALRERMVRAITAAKCCTRSAHASKVFDAAIDEVFGIVNREQKAEQRKGAVAR